MLEIITTHTTRDGTVFLLAFFSIQRSLASYIVSASLFCRALLFIRLSTLQDGVCRSYTTVPSKGITRLFGFVFDAVVLSSALAGVRRVTGFRFEEASQIVIR